MQRPTALWRMACSSKRAAVCTVSIGGWLLTAEDGSASTLVASFLITPDITRGREWVSIISGRNLRPCRHRENEKHRQKPSAKPPDPYLPGGEREVFFS